MDMIRFEKECPSLTVSMEFSSEVTWMEVTENFIGFLQASGYVFDPLEVGAYIMAAYDMGNTGCSGCGRRK